MIPDPASALIRQSGKRDYGSDKELVALVDLTELLGRTAFVLLEDTVEVGDVVESGVEAYVGDRRARTDEIAQGHVKTDADYIVGDRTACAKLEETAERRWRHAGHLA